MMSSKPLKPLKPLTPENIVLGKDYIIKNVQKNVKAIDITMADITIDDICNYIIYDSYEPAIYTFYNNLNNLTNDEENIRDMEREKYNKVDLRYDDTENKWYRTEGRGKKRQTIYFYVFECPVKTKEENLTPVEPNSIQKDKTYLISSCLQRFKVELDDIQEKTYYEDEETDDETAGEEGIYKLKKFSFKVINNNKKYVKQDENDLTLFAYKDENGDYKWKKYNIYKIFVPQATAIIENKISFEPKHSSKSPSKTKKTSSEYIPPEIKNEFFKYLRGGGRKTRKNKYRRNK